MERKMSESGWKWKKIIKTTEGGPEEGLEDEIGLYYSSTTNSFILSMKGSQPKDKWGISFILSMKGSQPKDKWGMEWERTEEAIIVDKKDIKELIKGLQELLEVDENPAQAVLFGEKDD